MIEFVNEFGDLSKRNSLRVPEKAMPRLPGGRSLCLLLTGLRLFFLFLNEVLAP